jgi:6-phosphogluconolactonase (cycloisomerase 2 family)
MTGCAGFWVYPGTANSTGTAGSDYVYVANAGAETLSGFVVGTGTLTAISGFPYSLGYVPTALVVNHANSILFVASNSAIYSYSIGTGGVLTALNNGSAIGTANVAAMDVSPDGQWLFALDENALTVDEFSINSSTGRLSGETQVSLSSVPKAVSSQAVKVSPKGDYVFVALGQAGDMVLPLTTSTGALGTVWTLAPFSSSTSDNALTVDPNSAYLYIARSGSGTGAGLAVYSIGSTGALTLGNTYTTGSSPYSVVMNAAGTDAYVADRSGSNIYGFSVPTAGSPAALTPSYYSSGSGVNALAMDKSGSYLLAAASGNSSLVMYSFSSGALVSSTTAVTGSGPVAIATTHP